MNTRPNTDNPFARAIHAAAPVVFLCLAALAAACSDPFTPYERLEGTRLLAVRADHPSLHAGESAVLDALVFNADDVQLTYRWSWCPVQGNPSDGFTCPITDEQLGQLVAAIAPDAALLASTELGDDATAALPYPGDPALVSALCEAIRSQPHPTHMVVPTCTRSLTVYVKLEITTPNDRLTAIKEVELLLDPQAEPNTNPRLEGIAAHVPVEGAQAQHMELLADGPTELPLRSDLTLVLRLADDSIESFVPEATPDEPNPASRLERPLFTWFVEDGELDAGRTGVVDGASTLEEALRNAWRPGQPADEVTLVVVARDGRGGVDWAQRRVRFF